MQNIFDGLRRGLPEFHVSDLRPFDSRQVAKYLEDMRRDWFGAFQCLTAAGAIDAAGLQVKIVLHSLQAFATVKAAEKLKLEAH